MADDPITHYIVVRKDLPTGTICAMIAHAAGESMYGCRMFNSEPITVVVLSAKNETHLRALIRKVDHAARHWPYHVVQEPDAPYNGAAMAIGFMPRRKSKFKGLFNGYRMLRFEA